jgi:hypothetical protein
MVGHEFLRCRRTPSGFRAIPVSLPFFQQTFRRGVVVIDPPTKYNPNPHVTMAFGLTHSDLLVSSHTKGTVHAPLSSTSFDRNGLPVAHLAGRRADHDDPGTIARAFSRGQRRRWESPATEFAAAAADSRVSFPRTNCARGASGDHYGPERDLGQIVGVHSKLADATRAWAPGGPHT